MKNWQKTNPPYEGGEPYLYFAFAEEDSGKVWNLLRPLLARGCRVWYCCGPSGSAEEVLRRQERSVGAALTVLYLSDAACADKDVKTNVLVNQKYNRPILCLDPDGTDRRLSMGLREDIPHVPLYQLRNSEEIEQAILHAEGFSQEMIGPAVRIAGDGMLKKLTLLFCALALLFAAISYMGFWGMHWFQPELQDEVSFSDPVLLAAVRKAASGGPITEELTERISFLRLDDLPESWEELSQLPALERIELPQQALAQGGNLPDGNYTIALSGGGT